MKTSHIALYSKYRPKNFKELLSQEVLVQTLSYAILNDKISQGYLLTGIRGIGKTTTARIIAKTINCTNLRDDSGIPVPCEECTNCRSFAEESHADILEMDAASRTGVDDVRIIIENAEYKPLLGKYKVFIIDEVHMLSKNAFNALLKLLEEPPLHSVFIFATTEVHKIPLTILSRCQRFDLKRFSSDAILNLLQRVCDQEGIRVETDALKIIAVKSDGSARDSLSILEQAITLASSRDGIISKAMLENMICAVNYEKIFEFLTSIIDKDAEKSLSIISEFYKTNTDFSVFIANFLSLLAYISKKFVAPNYSSEEFDSYKDEIDSFLSRMDVEFAQIAWQLSYKTQFELKTSKNQLELVEMLCVKLNFLLNSKTPSAEHPRRASQEILNQEVTENIDLSFPDFLKKLLDHKEMELYYYLFNKCEVRDFSSKKIHFISSENDPKMEQKIMVQIKSIIKQDVDIIIDYDENAKPHKLHIIDKFKSDKVIVDALKNFSELEIADILLEK